MNLLSDPPPGKAEPTIPSGPSRGQCSPHAVPGTFSDTRIPSTSPAKKGEGRQAGLNVVWAGHWAGKSRQIPACFAGETADRASYP